MKDDSQALAAIKRIVGDLPRTDQQRVGEWLGILIRIRQSNQSWMEKARAAVGVTWHCGVIRPIAIRMGHELKRIGWEERSWPARLALAGIVGATVASGEGAGIAAFGTAIGVPLWVVFGAGGALAGTVIQELKKNP